jgi:hypothetical protein
MKVRSLKTSISYWLKGALHGESSGLDSRPNLFDSGGFHSIVQGEVKMRFAPIACPVSRHRRFNLSDWPTCQKP